MILQCALSKPGFYSKNKIFKNSYVPQFFNWLVFVLYHLSDYSEVFTFADFSA